VSGVAIDLLTALAPLVGEPASSKKKKSHQVPVIRIEEIVKHPNADTLGLVHIGGYQVVVKLGEFETGDLAAYIQPDSIVPEEEEFAFMWEGRGYVDQVPIKYRRVTVRKFRKEWSEGLLIQVPEWLRWPDAKGYRPIEVGDDISDLLGVTHYEPPEPGERISHRRDRHGWPRSLRGWWYWLLEHLGFHPNGPTGGLSIRGPKDGRRVYDVENFKNYQNVFTPGEMVIVTEKIHGSNARYTFEDGVMYVGSRTMWKQPKAKCVWNHALAQNPAIEEWCRAHPGYTLYGEVVPTQGDVFRYGCAPGQVRFFLFDILNPQGEWCSAKELLSCHSN
jgi:hypothetical protein